MAPIPPTAQCHRNLYRDLECPSRASAFFNIESFALLDK